MMKNYCGNICLTNFLVVYLHCIPYGSVNYT